MALWEDKTRIKFIWNSGLQYKYAFSVNLPLDETYEKTKKFYESAKAIITKQSETRLELKRGSTLISRISPLIFTNEKWLDQIIQIEFEPLVKNTHVSIYYDSKIYYSLIFMPNTLVKESRKLEKMLNE